MQEKIKEVLRAHIKGKNVEERLDKATKAVFDLLSNEKPVTAKKGIVVMTESAATLTNDEYTTKPKVL